MRFDKHIIKSCALVVLFATGILKTQAQIQSTGVITTAAPSLRIPADARAGGMGNTGIATKADASSSYWNQSKAVFGKPKSAVSANYIPWMKEVAEGMYFVGVSGYHRFDTLQAITATIRYFNLGDFRLKDANGNILQSAAPQEFSVDMGYARKLSEKFSLGVALRYIHSKLANGNYSSIGYKAGTAMAGDVSLFYNGNNEAGQGVAAGLSLSNVGSKISNTEGSGYKEFLPANLGAGAAYTYIFNDDNSICISADINKLLVPSIPEDAAKLDEYYKTGTLSALGKGFSNKAWQYGAGVEYSYKKLFDLRAGYYESSDNLSGNKGFTAGIGFHYSMLAVNVSYLSPVGNSAVQNPLTNTFRFGVQLDF